jgi:hypothetical protein
MKISFDIHGVLTEDHKSFIKLAKCGLFSEVHIITGVTISDKLVTQLKNYNEGKQWWTELCSIEDELMKVIPPEGFNEFNRPYWDNYTWNSFKGNYCNDNNIDLHFDDTEAYQEYFIESKCIIYK